MNIGDSSEKSLVVYSPVPRTDVEKNLPFSESAIQVLCEIGDKICRPIIKESKGLTRTWVVVMGVPAGCAIGGSIAGVYGDKASDEVIKSIWNYFFPAQESTWTGMFYNRFNEWLEWCVSSNVTAGVKPVVDGAIVAGSGLALPLLMIIIMGLYKQTIGSKNQSSHNSLKDFVGKIEYDKENECYLISGRKFTECDTKNLTKLIKKYTIVYEILMSSATHIRGHILNRINFSAYSEDSQKRILRGIEELEGQAWKSKRVKRAINLIYKDYYQSAAVKLVVFHRIEIMRLFTTFDQIDNHFNHSREHFADFSEEIRDNLASQSTSIIQELNKITQLTNEEGVELIKRIESIEMKIETLIPSRNIPSDNEAKIDSLPSEDIYTIELKDSPCVVSQLYIDFKDTLSCIRTEITSHFGIKSTISEK